MTFALSELRNSTIWQLYRIRNRINHNPPYQRQSDIWDSEKRSLFIDTILNGLDVPKLYLHKFPRPQKVGGKSYDFALIDGKQRLETIWNFIEGNIAIDSDAKYFPDESIKIGGMKYDELGKTYPELKADFDGFKLTVMLIETDDIEMIEEMFSRLNEALPLAAAEKRNAYHGPIPVIIRKLSTEAFFTRALPFPNKRYRHFDLAAKFLLTEQTRKVVDTKKAYLDKFARSYETEPKNKIPVFVAETSNTLAAMNKIFTEKDSLLHQVGMIILYYHLCRIAKAEKWLQEITRKKLLDFKKLRDTNRGIAEVDITKADYDLIEFDRYTQSPNDGLAIKFRLSVLLKRAFEREVRIDDL